MVKSTLFQKSKILILTQKETVAIKSWKTPHLPLPLAIVNTNFLLRAKCWFRGRVGVKVFSQNLILIQNVYQQIRALTKYMH